MILYDKEVLANHTTVLNDRYLDIYVLDDDEYYNIHIIDDKFRDDELNTLYLQEPKEYVKLDEISSPLYLECIAIEHYLWDKFYGYNNNMYSFSCNLVDTCSL